MFQQDQVQKLSTGLWMLKAEYPEVLVAFATPRPTQVSVPFAALIDFTDYDARPLTVTLVHPCTRKVLKISEVLPQIFQNVSVQPPPRIARLRFGAGGQEVISDSILQGYDLNDQAPFLCLPGVRAYHDHPAHTGDSWWLHKMRGEGSLHTILHTLWKYGVHNVTGQHVLIQAVVAGFQVQPEIEPPVPGDEQATPPQEHQAQPRLGAANT